MLGAWGDQPGEEAGATAGDSRNPGFHHENDGDTALLCCRQGDADRGVLDMTLGCRVVFRIQSSSLPGSQASAASAALKAHSRVWCPHVCDSRESHNPPRSWESRTFQEPGVPHWMCGLARLGECSIPCLVTMSLLGSGTGYTTEP